MSVSRLGVLGCLLCLSSACGGSTEPKEQLLSFASERDTVEFGASKQLEVLAGGSRASEALTWTSSDPTIASVDANGLVTGLETGVVIITATAGRREAAVRLAVIPLAFTSITTGFYHACGLTKRGSLYCWGGNSYGTLGDGTTSDRYVPRAVGRGMQKFRFVDAGESHTCAIGTDGAVYCWGFNFDGQVGNGAPRDPVHAPVKVGGSLPAVSQVAVGENHSCALTTTGQVYCWGGNFNGELGDGTTTDRLAPVQTAGHPPFASLTAGARHNCGLVQNGPLYCWGSNFAGQLGDGTRNDRPRPSAVPTSLRFTQASGGRGITCASSTDATAYCWGGDRARPAVVAGAPKLASMAAGGLHSCGLTSEGAAYCWGWNQGALGNGNTTNSEVPVAVAGGHLFTALSVSWNQFTCGLATDGLAYCWGSNSVGELGDGTRDTRTTPTLVAGQR